jgi:3-deoxy-manno-octulosonate cytidylyltransferase (CMP-KDO synthetase)
MELQGVRQIQKMHTNMNIIAIIPARMGSSRFPGKPLAKILEKPMIGHVYDRVKQCNALSKTVVATCDKEIKDYIESIGGYAVMTSKDHERASDRCAEALGYIENEDGIQYDIMVMVQGDEPMTHPEMIIEAITPMLNNPDILVTNLVSDIKTTEEFEDRNCVKVVCDKQNNAIIFSREPIPTRSNISSIPMKKQVCIIPFTRKFLLEYTKMQPTPIEIIESVDMMRVLEHGLKVKMVPTKYQTHAVDTKDDLYKVEKMMNKIS